MLGRLVGAAFCAFLASAAGCGGTVREEPGEQLRTGGANRCKAACVPLVACGVAASSCSCSCPACAPDAPSCECAPCDCTPVTTTSSECESICGKAVKEVLEDAPACEGALVALLDCFASTTCKKGESPCQAEEGALKDCRSANRVSTLPPPGDTADPDPGDPVTPGTIACQISEATSSPADPGSGGHAGTVACESKWDSCSDGRAYRVECRVIDSTDLVCACFVNGEQGMSFVAPSCVTSVDQIDTQCGWSLE